jgi:hypothetical protein
MEILLDEEGRTWIERPASEGWRHYDVYDAEGRMIGELRTPRTIRGRLPGALLPRAEDRAQVRDDRDVAR